MQVLAPDAVWTADGLRTGIHVRVDAGVIVGLEPPARHPDAVEALPGRILLPGLVNAHSHAFQRAFRGHVQWTEGGDDFWTWRNAMYRVASSLSPEGLEAVSRLCFVEMAESGITKVGEFHYVHHQPHGAPYADPDELAKRVIAAATSVGLRICLLRTVYARGGPGRELGPLQLRFRDRAVDDALSACERLRAIADDRVTVGLAPHSVRAVPPDWLPQLAVFQGPVHAHVAEQRAEIDACKAEQGVGPLQAFERAGLLTERFCAVHLTWPDESDVARLVRAGARVCVCPSTELDLGDGFLPVDVRREVPLCLGSDSQAQIDLLDEARQIELHARAMSGRRNVLAPLGVQDGLAARLLTAATIDGDRALGGEGLGIQVGAPADLVAIDLRGPGLAGVPLLQAVAFVTRAAAVSDVWVGGKRIVVGGRHPLREAAIREAQPFLGVPD